MSTRRTFLKSGIGLAGGIAAASRSPWPTALGASARAAQDAPRSGGTLNIVIGGSITSLETSNIPFYEERKVLRCLYDPLIALGDDGLPLAERSLAESWEFTDPLTFVLHLRQGVKFHDGTDFDAEAAKFNLDRHLDPEVASSARSELTPVDSVEAVDPMTLQINLKYPVVAFDVTLFDRAGYQISPTAWEQYGKENFSQHAVGTGPFKLVELVPGERVTFERNPDYWASPMPYLDQITVRIVPDDATRLIELRSGGAQIADGLPYQDIARIREMPEVVLQDQLFRMEFLRWNVDSEYGKSHEFRQAFQWAIDREAIKRTVYFDTGEVGYAPYFPGTTFYNEEYKPFTRDPDKAKALLDQSGLPSPIQFTYYIDEDPVREREAQIYQANFADIGVTVNIQKEQDAAANARQDSGDYNLTPSWWGWRPDPYFYMPIFQSDGANFSYFQPGQWSDPAFDELVNDAAGEADLETRKAMYQDAAEMLNEGAAWVFYRFGPIYVGAAPNVRDYTDPRSTISDYAKVWLA